MSGAGERVESSGGRPIRVAHVATVDLTVRYLLLSQLTYLADRGYEVTAISAPGPWVADIGSSGIRHLAWKNATRSWAPSDDVKAYGELRALFERERFDLVHTHNPKPGILGRLAAWRTRVPCIVNTVHGFYAAPEHPRRRRWPVMSLERLAARSSDMELFQSEEDLAWARATGVVAPARSRLLGNGVDLSRFDPAALDPGTRRRIRTETSIPENATVVGIVGRVVEEKGYRDLIAAARNIRRDLRDVAFVALGDVDPSKPDSLTEAEIDAAREHIAFLGWREDVRDVMSIFDIFVLPSWREGLPRSAIEAAALGTSLVLSDVRGCREVARHGIEGLLVPPRDAVALEGALRSLLGDPQRRSELGRAARARAEDRFDERRVFEIIDDTYRDVLARVGITTGSSGPAARSDPRARIRGARPGDVAALARLHEGTLTTAFLSSLGAGFLSLLYRSLLSDPRSVVSVAEVEGRVVGFVAGSTDVARTFRRFYVRHGAPATIRALPRLTRRAARRKVLETARHPGEAKNLPPGELLAIGVEGNHRGRGIAGALTRAFLARMAQSGADEIKVVVGADNAPAIALYRRIGFEPVTTIEVHEGTTSNVLVYRCRSRSQS